jgi:hypothetical protein
VGFGILFSFLGVILFFDRGLLALGNVWYYNSQSLCCNIMYVMKLAWLTPHVILRCFYIQLDFLFDWSGPITRMAIYVATFHEEGKP